MNQLEYLPGIAGQSVQLDGPSAFVGIAEEMRSREWDYDLGYRDLVTATRPARTVDVTFHADYDTADTLRRVADADVMARTPGTFVAQNEWKQRGYILASDVDDIHYGRLSTGLKIALLDGAWWRLAKRSFVPEITTPEYRSATGETVTASGASGAPLHALTVDGKAVQDGTPTPSVPVDVQVVKSPNLIDAGDWIGSRSNTYYVEYAVNNHDYLHSVEPAKAGETYTLSMDVQTSVEPFNLSVGLGNGTYATDLMTAYSNRNGRVSVTFTPTAEKIAQYGNLIAFRVPRYAGQTTFDFSISNIQLEKGSITTPYIPYGSIGLNIDDTITPIDMQGNVLASLPDGTKDVLTVDSTGHCVLSKNVGYILVDGSTKTAYSVSTYSGKQHILIDMGAGSLPSITSIVYVICNKLPGVTGDREFLGGTGIANANNRFLRFCCDEIQSITTTAQANTWLQANALNVYYKLATPQTIDLGTIDMPAIPLDAQISVTAAVTPTITAEWQISRDAYLDYPHNYEYDFQKTSSTGSITPSVLTPSDAYLAVFGPAVNPYVIVGGNRYQVNVTVPSGGYLVVDGRDKTIQLTLADGTVQNVFSSGVRGGGAGGGSYIFERIPAGTSEVTYDGSFGFDLGWYEEEGEPPWSLS